MAQTRKQKIREDLRKQRRRRVVTTTSVVAVVMVVIVVGIILATRQSPPPPSGLIGQPISTTMTGYLQGVSTATLNATLNAQGVTPLQKVSGSNLTSGGKPEFLYIGADFCPYCAAMRWSIIVALLKFGSFDSNAPLTYMMSGDSPEAYPDTPTFSFYNAHYTSTYISFVSVETADRSASHNPLQTVTSDQQNLLNQWDSSDGIPFLDVGGQYVIHSASGAPSIHSGTPYDPSILIGNWTQIGAQLNNPSSSIAQHVDGEADYIISAICKIDGNQPGSICSQNYAQISITQAPIAPSQMPVNDLFNTLQASDMTETSRSWIF